MAARITKTINPIISIRKMLVDFLYIIFNSKRPSVKAVKINAKTNKIKYKANSIKAKGIPTIVRIKNKLIKGVRNKTAKPIKADCQFFFSKLSATSGAIFFFKLITIKPMSNKDDSS